MWRGRKYAGEMQTTLWPDVERTLESKGKDLEGQMGQTKILQYEMTKSPQVGMLKITKHITVAEL